MRSRRCARSTLCSQAGIAAAFVRASALACSANLAPMPAGMTLMMLTMSSAVSGVPLEFVAARSLAHAVDRLNGARRSGDEPDQGSGRRRTGSGQRQRDRASHEGDDRERLQHQLQRSRAALVVGERRPGMGRGKGVHHGLAAGRAVFLLVTRRRRDAHDDQALAVGRVITEIVERPLDRLQMPGGVGRGRVALVLVLGFRAGGVDHRIGDAFAKPLPLVRRFADQKT
jgi:hypothetical protein